MIKTFTAAEYKQQNLDGLTQRLRLDCMIKGDRILAADLIDAQAAKIAALEAKLSAIREALAA